MGKINLIVVLSLCFYFFSCSKKAEKKDFVFHDITTIKSKETLLNINYDSKLYRVKIGEFYGVINEEEQLIVPPIYDYIGYSGEGLIRVCKNKKWGYIDKKGKKITTLKYDYAVNFSEGLAVVKIKDKWAFIDDLGKEKSVFKYDNLIGFDDCESIEEIFHFVEGMMRVEVDGKYGYVNTLGNEVIKPQYESAGIFSEGLAPVTMNGVSNFINKKGKTIIKLPAKYDFQGAFQNGTARICLRLRPEEDSYFLKTGYIDKAGKIVIPVQYAFVTFDDHRDACYFHDHSGFSEGIANLEKNGRWGFINENGKYITPFKYDDAGSFKEGMAPVAKGNEYDIKWGFINKAGKEVIPIKYKFRISPNPHDFLAPSFSNGIAIVKYNDTWGGIDNKGQEIIPFNQYDQISDFSNGMARVELNNRYGYINKQDQKVIPIIYNYAKQINELIVVGINGKYGLLDEKGNKVTTIKYDWIEDSGKCFIAKIANKWGIVNKIGEIISPKYDEIYASPFPLSGLYYSQLYPNEK